MSVKSKSCSQTEEFQTLVIILSSENSSFYQSIVIISLKA